MHELLLAESAWPNPVVVTGLLLKPYSIGHDLRLTKLNNPLATSDQATSGQLDVAAMICHQDWRECERMPFDPFIRQKLWLWRRRARKTTFTEELAKFIKYRNAANAEFPSSGEIRRSGFSDSAPQIAGCPFLLRLYEFVHAHWNDSDQEQWGNVWNYPLGFAKLRYGCHMEEEGGWNIYNEVDKSADLKMEQLLRENEAKGRAML